MCIVGIFAENNVKKKYNARRYNKAICSFEKKDLYK